MTTITNEGIVKVEAETAKTQELLAEKPIHRLNRWLDENNARELWTQKIPGTKIRMSAHTVKGNIFLVQEFLTDRGFEIFIPTTKENNIDAAFTGLENYIAEDA